MEIQLKDEALCTHLLVNFPFVFYGMPTQLTHGTFTEGIVQHKDV